MYDRRAAVTPRARINAATGSTDRAARPLVIEDHTACIGSRAHAFGARATSVSSGEA